MPYYLTLHNNANIDNTNIIISTIYNLTCSSKQQVGSTASSDFTKLQVIRNISLQSFKVTNTTCFGYARVPEVILGRVYMRYKHRTLILTQAGLTAIRDHSLFMTGGGLAKEVGGS